MSEMNFADQRLESLPWKGQDYWVSQYNFVKEIEDKLIKPKEVIIHDSTLRDGEQAPGLSFNKNQKIEVAKMLNDIGVQYIEAGFPAISKEEANTISEIAKLDLNAKITCLTRATKEDVDRAVDCGVWGAIIEVPVGYPRLKYQFEWKEEEVINKTMEILDYAKSKGLNVILFLIDATRARGDFLKKLLVMADETKNIDKVSVVDTLGCANPEAINYMVKNIKKWVSVPLEVHVHNDFGLGTINTIAGLMAGAESFSCTVNGIGQRGGNASLEEIVLALKLLYGVETNIDITKLKELSLFIQELSNIKVPPYKPVVGSNLFDWEAGIPTAALRKLPLTVEPYTPKLLGEEHNILLGKKSGKANILYKLEENNLDYDKKLIDKLLAKSKEIATNNNKPLTNNEFLGIYKQLKG